MKPEQEGGAAPAGFVSTLRRRARPATGLFVKLPSTELAEIVAHCGFDFVIIDAEHALVSERDVYHLITAYDLAGVPPLVRLTHKRDVNAGRYLDAGAAGVVLPHVVSGAEAVEVTHPLLFPPHGTRGMGSSSRAGRWGLRDGGAAAYLAHGNAETARMPMIEDSQALAEIDAICQAPGVNAVFIGPSDLALSMGTTASDPQIAEAVARVAERAVGHGVAVGTVARSESEFQQHAARGCSFLVVGNDTGLFIKGAKSTLAQFRSGAADS